MRGEGCRVQSLGFKVQGYRVMVLWGSRIGVVQGWAWGLELYSSRVWGYRFWV